MSYDLKANYTRAADAFRAAGFENKGRVLCDGCKKAVIKWVSPQGKELFTTPEDDARDAGLVHAKSLGTCYAEDEE